MVCDDAHNEGGEGTADVAEDTGKTVGRGAGFLGALVGCSYAYQGLGAVDAEARERESSDRKPGWKAGHKGEDSQEHHSSCHCKKAHSMGLALEDVVGGPPGEDGAYDGGKFKYSHADGGIVYLHSAVFGKELGTPVQHAHTEYIHENVGKGEHPYPLVAEDHLPQESRMGSCLAFQFLLAGLGTFELG